MLILSGLEHIQAEGDKLTDAQQKLHFSFSKYLYFTVVYSTSQSNLLARLMAALPMPASIANNIEWKRPPPRVVVKNVKRATNKIILAFQLSDMTGDHAKIMAYQMYAYTHTGSEDRSSNILWRSLGVVDAQPLPMSVTLTQEETKDQFYFSVRAVDEHQRTGLFSVPRTW